MIDNTIKELWIVTLDGEVIDAVDDMIVANEIVKYHSDDEELKIYTEKEYEELYGDILVVDNEMGIVARFLDESDAIDLIMEYSTEDQLFIYTQGEYEKLKARSST